MKPYETIVIIKGILLTEAQSMALRVAVQNFLMDLNDPEHMAALGDVGPLYRNRLLEIQAMMVQK